MGTGRSGTTERKNLGWDNDYQTPKITPAELTSEESAVVNRNNFKLCLPKDYLSPTAICSFLRCGLQYEFRYVRDLVIPPNVSLIRGSCNHTVLETNNKHKKKTGRDYSAKQLITGFKDVFAEKKREIGDWQGEKEQDVLGLANKTFMSYSKTFAHRLQPKHVEKRVQIDFCGIKLLGFSDVIGVLDEKQKSVIDYKSSNKSMSLVEMEGSLQLAFYGWYVQLVTENNAKDVELGICRLSNLIDYKFIQYRKSYAMWVRRVVLYVARSISMGNFVPCDPSSWCCSKKWCGYYGICRGKA